jgi:N-acylneuraminate cytidylyltransferase
MNVVIIPARGGSKGIPGKNIRPLAGKPLIVWSIEQGLAAATADRVIVSTDDPDIAAISQNAGAEVIERPAELSGDEASSESAIAHVLQTLTERGQSPDNVIFLQCTSPIRSPGAIDEAFAEFQNRQADSLLSVSPSHKFLWTRNREGFGVPQNYDPLNRPRRQEMANTYQENGSFYIFSRACFERFGNRLGERIALYVMSEEASYEIDSPTDFFIVETLMKMVGAR